MEHGSVHDPSKATFSLVEEDHTLANALRFSLNQDPRVAFCGYSSPHPSDARVNIRVQSTGDPAREVLKDACYNLMFMCHHVRKTFENAVNELRRMNLLRWSLQMAGQAETILFLVQVFGSNKSQVDGFID